MENGAGKDIARIAGRKNPIRALGNSQTAQKPNAATALFIETLALLAVFTVVAIVLVKGFLFAGMLSREAASLSNAVHLAENAAEMVSASKSGEMLFSLLNENGNARISEQTGDSCVYRASYDANMNPAAGGVFYAEVSWVLGQDGLVKSTVAIYRNNEAEALYSLDLAVYVKGN